MRVVIAGCGRVGSDLALRLTADGHDDHALFESVSAGASVGLSVGVTAPSMPALLKLTYILQMWAGRLEFVAVFALAGFTYAWVRGR